MKTGFIIVNYNDFETVQVIINNIKNYSIIDKIVIVDNCSTDNSFGKLKEVSNEKIVVIKNLSNKGYGSGINYGSKYLIELYGECNIFVSNADIVIEKEKDLMELKSILNKDKNIAVVAPVIKEHSGLNRGWKIPTPFKDTLLNLPYIHKILRPKLLFYKESYYKNIVEVEAISGCFFLIKSSILQEIDFFDENLFLYYEENVLADKLKRKNKKTVIHSEISVFHNHSVTIDKSINHIKKYKILKQSQMYFQKKYNKANIIEQLGLFITNKFTLFILYLMKR